MERGALGERIRQLARDEAFALVGIAALRPASSASAYREWLRRGDQAEMSWMERHVALREDPRGLLPGAMSALVVGLRYGPAEASGQGEPGELWSRVARYARGRDYHDVIRERLERVAAAIAALAPGCATRICVDTAPLLERELAARAGLGAIGKNTMLLNPDAGSWFLIGELLLTLDLPPDQPVADLCGECTRCLEACPTGALAAPYRLDSRRCLSYWTIEHRGEIAPEFVPHLRDWVFGCDVCQEVCPWNAGAAPVRAAEFEVPEARRQLDLTGLLHLGPEEYRERFRGSPLRRAKLDGLRRNAAASLEALRSEGRR